MIASAVILGIGLFAWVRAGLSGALQGTDFVTFYASSEVLLAEGPGHVYELEAQRQAQAALFGAGGQPFLPDPYPPFWIMARFWLALLPLGAAYLVWGALTLTATVAAVTLLARVAGTAASAGRQALIVAGSPPAVISLLQGQPDAFMLLGAALSLWLWTRGHEFGAGAALSALLIKPQLGVPLLGMVLVRRSAPALAGLLAGAALLLLASLAAFRLEPLGAWLRLLAADQGAVLRPWLTLRAPLVWLHLAGPLQYGLLALLILAVLALMAGLRVGLISGFGLATAAGLLLAPHLNLHDLILLAVPGTLVAAGGRGRLAAATGYLAATAAIWIPPAAWLADLALAGAAARQARHPNP